MEGMFSRFKTRVLNAVSIVDIPTLPIPPSPLQNSGIGAGGVSTSGNGSHRMIDNKSLPNKFTYNRPAFLQLVTQDELRASADHNVRPIIVPRDIAIMPWNTGYAECVNSGKSEWNEDQAAFYRHILIHPTDKDEPGLPYTYFGIFDGHAGYGAALAASHQFHYILHEKLVDVIDLLMAPNSQSTAGNRAKSLIDNIPHPMSFYRNVSKDELIIGALEAAFLEMDALLAGDRNKYRNAGGCTALVSLFINGKMFVSNAGDSRAILCQRMSTEMLSTANHPENLKKSSKQTDDISTTGNNKKMFENNVHIFPIPFSHDHTPETERLRLMSTAQLNPQLMADHYIATEYAKRPMQRDLGKRVLYRHGTMKGWAYKTLTTDDLKIPIVTGEGKRSRLLGTIGVTRGFGDHDLRALCTGLLIKPFLSPHPEVNYRDLTKVVSVPDEKNEDGEYGILIMATDGLWDVLDTETVSKTVFSTLNKYPIEKHRYTMVAQELVAKSRGRINDAGHWRLAESKAAATVDDISVIVIPVHQYFKEYMEWHTSYLNRKQNHKTDSVNQSNLPKGQSHVTENISLSLEPLTIKDQTIDVSVEAIEAKVDEDSSENRSINVHQNGRVDDQKKSL